MKTFAKEEQGQDILEYALLVALIALVAVASLQNLSTTIGSIWTVMKTRLAS